MYAVSPQAYDRAITLFSPDGRLFQVEYAKEAVKKGSLAIGMITKKGSLLIAYKPLFSKLVLPSSVKKVWRIDDHIIATSAGLIGDARRLIDYAQLYAQRYRLYYAKEIAVSSLARELADITQIYTQNGGVRPFGVSLLFAGFVEKPELYEVEPSGALSGYYATAIGNFKKEAEEMLLAEYKFDMKVEEAIKLGVKIIKKLHKNVTVDNVEIGLVEEGKEARIFTNEEKKKWI